MMSTFLRWNDALASRFFKPEAKGQTVWLYVSDELVESIGEQAGLGGVTDFINAAKGGPPWPAPSGLCQKALKAYEGWRDRGLEYPPYVIYLGLFVLAAGVDGDFAAHAYYPRLRTLLGDPPTTGEIPSFHRMYELWDDLEQWSVRDRSGEVGIFEAHIAGGMIHIGLPLGQSLLADRDRRSLPVIFARADLDPSTPPPDAEILRALRNHGSDLLRPWTLRLLSGTGEREALDALAELVAEELSEWNGETPAEGGRPASGGVERQVNAGLRLCIALDRPSGRARATLRCTLNRRDFPESGLFFPVAGAQATCDEDVPGWSTHLVDVAVGRPVDAARIDWLNGFTANEARLGWRLRLPPRSVRVLVEGATLDLPGLVEVLQLPRDRSFYLMFHERELDAIGTWGRACCEAFQVIELHEGLPAGWRIGSASRVTAEDAEVSARYPMLALPSRLSLRLVGGIRSGPGASFFGFAPPCIVAEGGTGPVQLRCNGQPLQARSDGVSYELPHNLPVETRILLEVMAGGDVLRRQSLYLTGDFAWNGSEPQVVFNEWGEPLPPLDPGGLSAGALVRDESGEAPFKRPVLLAPGLSRYLDRRVFFIGRSPGEILAWPAEPLSDAWHPVWAVPMARRGVGIFCGSGISDSVPSEARGLDPARIEQWKAVLWHSRKRITPPSRPRLAALWRMYSEAARHA